MSLWDDHEPDPRDFENDNDGSPRSAAPRCKYCGSRAVYWVHSGVRWRLYNTDATALHVCERRTDASDFDDLTVQK